VGFDANFEILLAQHLFVRYNSCELDARKEFEIHREVFGANSKGFEKLDEAAWAWLDDCLKGL
jgi:hypothetical protein